jgi:putative ABC transport system substrate-binding protein
MIRREFIALAGGAAVGWPLAARAQHPERVRRLGVFIGFSENDPLPQRMVSAFAQALGRFGWVEGKNFRIDYRFAAGNPTLYRTYAAEMVGLAPDVILASPGTVVAALLEKTRTIPIVFVLPAQGETSPSRAHESQQRLHPDPCAGIGYQPNA